MITEITDPEALVQLFYREILYQGNLAVADELVSSDFVIYSPGLPPTLPRGPAGIKQLASLIQAGFPDDLRISCADPICAGNKVVICWTACGTHTGAFLGLAPTGKPVTATGIDIFRLADSEIVEWWHNSDGLSILQQLSSILLAQQDG